MKRYFVKTPALVKKLYPHRVWEIKDQPKTVYLTFDDGPIPVVTPWVLEQLKQYDAKASFFCIGNNIASHPDIFHTITAGGHTVGNHTYNHIKGTGATVEAYLNEVEKAEKEITDRRAGASSKYFRPPYGRMSGSQARLLREKGYTIVMWDVLSADFDATVSREECLNNVIKNTDSGSVVIFHDSLKAQENLYYALPRVLQYFSDKGYTFAALD